MKWLKEDIERGEEQGARMMREVLALANSIEKDIELTMDIPSHNPSGKLPVLDLMMWVETREGEEGSKYQEVMHEYYEKCMVAPRVIHQESALPEKVKRQTLTQEIIRIRKNTSERLRGAKKSEQMTRFNWKMWRSGYGAKSRRRYC